MSVYFLLTSYRVYNEILWQKKAKYLCHRLRVKWPYDIKKDTHKQKLEIV